jgi:hypothetical protein
MQPDDDREVPEQERDGEPESLPFEAEPADVLEQDRTVPGDDDEYREG